MNEANKLIEITIEEYTQKITEAYERGFKDGIRDSKLYRDKSTSNIPYTPAPYDLEKQLRWEKPVPDIHYLSDDDMYEKAPYWMRPGFKMPQPTCKDSTTGTDKW